jgi:hypothetical protein
VIRPGEAEAAGSAVSESCSQEEGSTPGPATDRGQRSEETLGKTRTRDTVCRDGSRKVKGPTVLSHRPKSGNLEDQGLRNGDGNDPWLRHLCPTRWPQGRASRFERRYYPGPKSDNVSFVQVLKSEHIVLTHDSKTRESLVRANGSLAPSPSPSQPRARSHLLKPCCVHPPTPRAPATAWQRASS